MSNPTFRSGPVTQKAAAAVEKHRLVTLGENGISHAGADGVVFGAVTENAAPDTDREANNLAITAPSVVAVHIGGVVPLAVADGATGLTLGATVYAAADGKVSNTGTVKAGVIVATPGDAPSTVRVHLRLDA